MFRFSRVLHARYSKWWVDRDNNGTADADVILFIVWAMMIKWRKRKLTR